MKAHEGQIRKYTGTPYIYHPLRVGQIVADEMANRGGNIEAVMAAILHDVIEDTKKTNYDIVTEFGSRVAGFVDELTNKHIDKAVLREIRKAKENERLANVSKEAQLIKLADRLDNLQDLKFVDDPFKIVYANETLDLLDKIGDSCESLADKVYAEVMEILKVETEEHED
jgi:(p)ppGpp synthase/HD superfamily hydrolase